MIKKNLIGTALATTVALAFTVAPITQALADNVKCYGVNSCKGQSACKTSTFYAHACKGQNSCKGQGYLELTKEQCEKMHGTETEPTQSGNTNS
ncbi:MAG TPA: hypothetical protein VHE99_12830 [Gammaproteobacteria bacterium]|nr:hypothetical protein [Gammaproteobacteria bacterium]